MLQRINICIKQDDNYQYLDDLQCYFDVRNYYIAHSPLQGAVTQRVE